MFNCTILISLNNERDIIKYLKFNIKIILLYIIRIFFIIIRKHHKTFHEKKKPRSHKSYLI